jgi:hypothetical protein
MTGTSPDIWGEPDSEEWAEWPAQNPDACPCHAAPEDHEADECSAAAIVARSPVQLLDERLAELPPNVRARIIVTDDPCRWIGTPPLDKNGYARFAGKGLYRVVWELLFGPVAAGLVLDHVKDRGCATNACSWPLHLEPVTPRINCLRGRSFAAVNFRKDRCGTCGEPFDLFNTYWKPNGHRDCRACIRRRVREYKGRQRGAGLGLAA